MAQVFATSNQKESLGNKFRIKRMRAFKNFVSSLPKPVRILDVGGAEYFWENADYQNNPDYQITILNLDKYDTNSSNMTSVIGDATDLSEFETNSYDIVFSNSVIEHLYTEQNQIKMANECMRVGVKYFIQTPNKYFFIEPHYVLPFFQFLPKSFRFWVLTNTKLSRGHKWSKEFAEQYLEEIKLLSISDMKRLFPNSKIWKESFFGMTKSITSHNFE